MCVCMCVVVVVVVVAERLSAKQLIVQCGLKSKLAYIYMY